MHVYHYSVCTSLQCMYIIIVIIYACTSLKCMYIIIVITYACKSLQCMYIIIVITYACISLQCMYIIIVITYACISLQCMYIITVITYSLLQWYGVAMTSRLLKIVGLFCKRALQKRLYSAKETYNFKEPTNHSHPIPYSLLHLECHSISVSNSQSHWSLFQRNVAKET